jgi:hypothetical protein
VRGAQRDQRADPLVAVHALHVVAGDQAAEAVPHDVYSLVARLLADALDVLTEVGGPAGHVGKPRAVVPGTDVRESAPAQAAAHHREDRAVVDQPVHEQHGDAGGEGVGGEESPHAGRLVARPVPRIGTQCFGACAERVHQDVCPDPGQFREPAGDDRRVAQRPQTTSWRSARFRLDVRLWTGARTTR